MARKRHLIDYSGTDTGNSWTSNNLNDEDPQFRDLMDQQEGCTYCDYDGALRLTHKGYKCPECRELVIPNE